MRRSTNASEEVQTDRQTQVGFKQGDKEVTPRNIMYVFLGAISDIWHIIDTTPLMLSITIKVVLG